MKLKLFCVFFTQRITMNANKLSAIIIGDRVITNMGSGIRITPLKWVQKGNTYNVNKFETITFETNKEAARIIRELADGILTYNELVKTYF